MCIAFLCVCIQRDREVTSADAHGDDGDDDEDAFGLLGDAVSDNTERL